MIFLIQFIKKWIFVSQKNVPFNVKNINFIQINPFSPNPFLASQKKIFLTQKK